MNIDTSLDQLGKQHREAHAPEDMVQRVWAKIGGRLPARNHNHTVWLATLTATGLAVALIMRPAPDSSGTVMPMPGLNQLTLALPDNSITLPGFSKIRTVTLPAVPQKRTVVTPAAETTGHLKNSAMENSV